MLTIRAAQMSALIDARLGQVAEELKDYLRLNHAEAIAGLDEAELLRRIKVGLRRARRWGFETYFGLGLFVALMFEVAPNFDTDSRIQKLLADESRSPDDRLDAIGDLLSEAEWDEVAERADPRAWEN